MNYRRLGKTDWKVSEISVGTWQLGGKWGGPFDHGLAVKTLNAAIDHGINFIDTADVYRDGLSEQTVGEVVRSRDEEIIVATKCGRKITPHTAEGYTPEALRKFVEDSLENTGLDTIDLMQLHCPPIDVYYSPEIFEVFDKLKDEGKIRFLGVSVEKVEEGLKAIEYPNVATVQIIFNMFRHRPAELFFEQSRKKDIGVIARVPLASGLLTGKLTSETSFSEQDHRYFNRDGSAFDVGETFSGVNYERGLEAVEELRKLFPDSQPLAEWALAWILTFSEVSTVIPGASKVEHVISNAQASDMASLSEEQMEKVKQLYVEYIKPAVHHRW